MTLVAAQRNIASIGHSSVSAAADGQSVRRVPIGPVTVEVAGDGGGAADDFTRLYRDWADGESSGPVLQMAIRQTGGGRWRRRYAIEGDGETLFEDLSVGEVLPYLEWGINYRLMGRLTSFLQLHAATLAWRGRGVMLVGESGSGKSSLTAILAARGWAYLSDEFALIEPDTLELHAFPKALCVKAGSFGLVRSLGLPLWRRRHWVKAFKGPVGYVSPHDLVVADRPVPIRLIVFPRFTGGEEVRIYPVERSQAAFSVAANAFNRAEFGDQALSMLAAVVDGAKSVVVEPGRPAATASTLEQLLAACPA